MEERQPFDANLLNPEPRQMQSCQCCEFEKPLDEDHYDRDSAQDSGFRSVCKECRKIQYAKQIIVEKAEAARKLNEQMIRNLANARFLSDLPVQDGVSLERLVNRIKSAFGGEEGMAQAWIAVFANANNQVQAKLMMAMMSSMGKVNDKGGGGANIESKSTEELKEQFNAVLKLVGPERMREYLGQKLPKALVPDAN